MWDFLEKENNYTTTLNGAGTLKSSTSDLVDFFFLGGAARGQEARFVSLFERAYEADQIKAIQILFYLRDIRGGQGERANFRAAYKKLAHINAFQAISLIPIVSTYGRFDDLFALENTPAEVAMIDFLAESLKEDASKLKGESISLLAKWLPSEPSMKKTRKPILEKLLIRLRWDGISYRKVVSRLRSELKIVEKHMSNKEWDQINFDNVPSQALLKLNKAFTRHRDDFLTWIEDSKSKINTATLQPHQIVQRLRKNLIEPDIADAIWKSLPSIEFDSDTLIMADVSGSMESQVGPVRPMDVSIALAIYFAEQNKGAFKNKFMTFSSTPSLVDLNRANSIKNKVHKTENADWGGSTNLEASFDLILLTAIKNNLAQSELPARLVIISDMEFNSAVGGRTGVTLFEHIKNKWNEAGYTIPELIFWNVQPWGNNVPVSQNEYGVKLLSGFSPSIMNIIIKGKSTNPYDFMLEVIENSRYDLVEAVLK